MVPLLFMKNSTHPSLKIRRMCEKSKTPANTQVRREKKLVWTAIAIGLAGGVYSGLTYGLKESRGVHDWKNSALAGVITGATLAMTCEDYSHEHIVQCAITGAAISTVANILTGIF